MGVESCSTSPVQGNEVEGKRARKSGNVLQAWALWEPEVCEGQVEEVDDHEQERPPEVAASPEIDKAKSEEIVQRERWSKVNSRCDITIWSKEVVDVTSLCDVQDNPVNASNDWVQGEWCVMYRVLSPNGMVMKPFSMAVLMTAMW